MHISAVSRLALPPSTGTALELGWGWPGAVTLPAPKSHQGHRDSPEARALLPSCPTPGEASAGPPGSQLPSMLWGDSAGVGTGTGKQQTHY